MSASKRLITEETGKQIAANLGIIAGDKLASMLTSWAAVAAEVRQGYGPAIFNVGDIITEKWADTAAKKDYDFDWRVNHFGTEEDQLGNTINGMLLEMKWASPFSVQFSHQRAFYACPDGLAAGTYHFDFADNWGNNLKKGITYQFTLTKAVEKGGRLAGCYGAPDTSPSSWQVYSYGADGMTLSETVSVSVGSAGTNLGTMTATTRSGNLNCFQEMAYGLNSWKKSALRQYLNSDKPKGQWWTAQDQWDIVPDQLASVDGFLCGIPAEMLKAVRTVKVTTYSNTNSENTGAEVTYDRFFPLSLEQMYITPEVSGEGDANEYYRILNGTSIKYAMWATYPELRHYAVDNHTSAQPLRLRSAFRGRACDTWFVGASGGVSNGYAASNAVRFSPACVIG